MPLVEEGVIYPRVVESPFGLPEGWKAIEKAYGANSKSAGGTYVRYESPQGGPPEGSIGAAIKKHATDNGLNPDEALKAYKKILQEKEAQKLREKEERAQFRESRIQRFQDKYGPLNGATICCIPGWRGESKFLEVSGQISTRYYDPEGVAWSLVKDIEAMFGERMERGETIPDVDAARASVELDEFGKPVHSARSAENIVATFEISKGRKGKRVVREEDYVEDGLQVLALEQLRAKKVTSAEALQNEGDEVRRRLQLRGLAADTAMLYVTKSDGGNGSERLSGMYYQKPGLFNQRPLYQRVAPLPSGSVVAHALHIFWSSARECWKLGMLDDRLAGFAICSDDRATPVGLSAKWLLCECAFVRSSN